MKPFYSRAQSICELGPYDYNLAKVEKSKKLSRMRLAEERVRTVLFRMSRPTRFGKVYFDGITKARNVTVYLYANVLDIQTTKNGRLVTQIEIATFRVTNSSCRLRYSFSRQEALRTLVCCYYRTKHSKAVWATNMTLLAGISWNTRSWIT